MVIKALLGMLIQDFTLIAEFLLASRVESGGAILELMVLAQFRLLFGLMKHKFVEDLVDCGRVVHDGRHCRG